MDPIVQSLYALQPKDVAGGPVGRRFVVRSGTQGLFAQLSLAFFTQTERDSVYLIESWSVELAPGAGQNALSAYFELLSEDGAYLPVYTGPGFSNPRLAAAERFYANCYHPLAVFGGDRVQCVADFSAGAASNLLRMSIAGWVVPRGTLQR